MSCVSCSINSAQISVNQKDFRIALCFSWGKNFKVHQPLSLLHKITFIFLCFLSKPPATVTNTSCIIALLLWKPHFNQLVVFFIFPALWGLSDAIWQTQTNGKSWWQWNEFSWDIKICMFIFISNLV